MDPTESRLNTEIKYYYSHYLISGQVRKSLRGFNTEKEMSTLFSGGRIFDGMGFTLDDHAMLVEDQKI